MFLWSRHGFPVTLALKEGCVLPEDDQRMEKQEGESGNKGGRDDGLMEWMSNCVDDSG